MNSCELPPPGEGAATSTRVTEKGSRLHRFRPGGDPAAAHAWQGVPAQEYKPAADDHRGVLRALLVGGGSEKTSFEVRYFEIAPGGFTTLEHHRHEHAVLVLRGHGEVLLGEGRHEVGYGDIVYVAAGEVHQLRNPGEEPFGFLCVVDRERDRPVPVPP
jgi:ribulose-bisphosphate carboxylase large chain